MPIKKTFNPLKLKPSPLKDKLPKKMWKLLEVAIADVKSVFASDNVSIDFDSWVDHPDTAKPQCTVCLGGSVILGRLCAEDLFQYYGPNGLEEHNKITSHDMRAIEALDNVRFGLYDEAFNDLYDGNIPEDVPAANTIEFVGSIVTKKQKKEFLDHLVYLKNLYKKADV